MPEHTPMAWDEAGRLDALRALKLLDTPAEERFDRVTRTAQALLQVPIALVSLVDTSRQWFKSCQGLAVRETPRAISFCTHAILQDDIFVVEDALRDPRFATNPLVLDPPHIRFYAGKPLYSAGKKVGTLCLIDTVPRQMRDDERIKLDNLAAWAEREINLFSLEADALQRLETKLRLGHLLEYATDGMLGADGRGVIDSVNPAACAMVFSSTTARAGPHRLFMDKLRQGPLGQVCRALEVSAVRKDGSEFPLEVSFRSLALGERIGFVGIVRDITERKHAQRIKSEFIATVSHELRTPLTSIIGALSLLREDLAESPPEQRELLEIAYQNGHRMTALVNDILDIEKLDAHMMTFQRESVDVRELLDEVGMLNGPFARQLGARLQLPAGPLAHRISIDRSRVIQVLTNLISNACKFTPPGSEVRIAAAPHGDWLRVSVTDQGPGIPDEFRGRIFQRFAQALPSRDNKTTGTGLGLSLSKEMVERMGGRIGFDSIAGQGATFYIEFPFAQ